MCYVYDAALDRSSFVVLDASDITKPPSPSSRCRHAFRWLSRQLDCR